MEILSLPECLPVAAPPRAVVALGFFDGVHKAHAAVLSAAAELASEKGLPLLVYTFRADDSPKRGALLSTDRERAAHFCSAGARYAAFVPFSEVGGLSPQEFTDCILLTELHAAATVVGTDFRFGRGALGDVTFLKRAMAEAGGECRTVATLSYGGDPISSSRIREHLAVGDCRMAAHLLGRPYSLTLPVARGRHLGHTLGFPTVNQHPDAGRCIPSPGVYVTEVTLPDGSRRLGVTDVGTRPTVAGEGIRLETHIIDFSGDLYGQELTVAFLHRLRDERRFSSLSELTARIAEDCKEAKAWMLAHGRS